MKKINFENNVTKANADTFNTMQDNIEEEINKLNTYSTEEQIVGTWIDGKPLYEKTIIKTGGLSTGDNNIEHGINGLKHVIDESTTLTYANNTSYHLPVVGSSGSSVTFYISANQETFNIRVINDSWSSLATVYTTLLYTKTTD